MARLRKKFIRFGTGTDDVNGQVVPANFTPSNSTPSQVASEGTDKISAHLKGIDDKFGTLSSVTGDIGHTSFSAANNQASPVDVTGLAFANGVVRGAQIFLTVYVNATSSLYEKYDMQIIQKGSSWEMAQTAVGDDSGFVFTITTAGQVQYTNNNYSGFTAATLKFRAMVLQV